MTEENKAERSAEQHLHISILTGKQCILKFSELWGQFSEKFRIAYDSLEINTK